MCPSSLGVGVSSHRNSVSLVPRLNCISRHQVSLTTPDTAHCPANMPDPVWTHFAYRQLWPLWSECNQNHAILYIMDLTPCICLGSILPNKVWIILCRTGPDLIWMAVQNSPGSGLDGMARFFSNAAGPEATTPISMVHASVPVCMYACMILT